MVAKKLSKLTTTWGRMINRWHDEVGPFHRLREDGSPGCNASYYASGGSYPSVSDSEWKCGNCKRLKEPKA